MRFRANDKAIIAVDGRVIGAAAAPAMNVSAPLLAATGAPSRLTSVHSYTSCRHTRLAMRSGSTALVSAIIEYCGSVRNAKWLFWGVTAVSKLPTVRRTGSTACLNPTLFLSENDGLANPPAR